MKLTDRQKNVLRQVRDAYARSPADGLRRGCTNSTLCALERRGLVQLEFVKSRHLDGATVEKWTLTEAGAALYPLPHPEAMSGPL